MADEETKVPKPKATPAKAKEADDATPEVSAEIPMMAEALTPDEEVKKPAARKTAAAKAPAKAVDRTTAKSIVAGKAAKAEAKPKTKVAKPERKPVVKKGDSPLDVLVYNGAGEHSGELHLPDAIFGQEPNMGVMHQALQRQLNNARQGTSSTKTRAMVRGGGRKPFRQKGLGRSRHGSEREPSMVGGGVAFGPHPRSYRQEMPRKMRRLALRSALAVKASEGKVSVIEGFADMAVPRTRTIVDLLDSVGVEGTALVVLAASNEMVARSAANLTWAKTILAHNLNLYDIFTHDHVVIAKDALELIEQTFQA
ncbi:MAG TPA: 50S ribosomal protein L4 [Candidatus Dormibacteraeota bacterium]|jgi:large subunit ribosomal protein L4